MQPPFYINNIYNKKRRIRAYSSENYEISPLKLTKFNFRGNIMTEKPYLCGKMEER